MFDGCSCLWVCPAQLVGCVLHRQQVEVVAITLVTTRAVGTTMTKELSRVIRGENKACPGGHHTRICSVVMRSEHQRDPAETTRWRKLDAQCSKLCFLLGHFCRVTSKVQPFATNFVHANRAGKYRQVHRVCVSFSDTNVSQTERPGMKRLIGFRLWI